MAAILCAAGCASGGGDDDYDPGSGVADAGAPLADGGTHVDGSLPGETGGLGDSNSTGDEGTTADAGATDAAVDAPGAAIDAPAPDAGGDVNVTGQKTVFVTSAVYSGNLGGLGGADGKCQGLATAANLNGTYKAWLSDGTATAAARLTHSSGPYVLVDGTVIATDWTQLASGALLDAIDKTEQNGLAAAGTASGQACFGIACAWTDTNADGTLAQGSYSCQDWSSQSSNDNAVLGETSATSTYWSSFATSSGICDLTAPLYCVQQ
ncbi:MAG TPA: hypothetical protein VMI75_24150 [Polyangiaceae bacterium]|nr:hypothetical protein [Polyangiaceae bacterium]